MDDVLTFKLQIKSIQVRSSEVQLGEIRGCNWPRVAVRVAVRVTWLPTGLGGHVGGGVHLKLVERLSDPRVDELIESIERGVAITVALIPPFANLAHDICLVARRKSLRVSYLECSQLRGDGESLFLGRAEDARIKAVPNAGCDGQSEEHDDTHHCPWEPIQSVRPSNEPKHHEQGEAKAEQDACNRRQHEKYDGKPAEPHSLG